MNIGYGYKRATRSFEPYDVEHVWGDTTPERPELAALMGAGGRDPAVRSGETLVLLHHADIGDDWRQRRRVLVWLASHGVMVQVRDQPATLYDTDDKLAVYKSLNGGDRTQRDPGRPTKVKWTAETASKFGATWYGPFSKGLVRSDYERITGKRFDLRAENNVKYIFGPRDGSRKARFNQIVEEAD